MGLCHMSEGGGYLEGRVGYKQMGLDNKDEESQRDQIRGRFIVIFCCCWGVCDTENQTSLFSSLVCYLLRQHNLSEHFS